MREVTQRRSPWIEQLDPNIAPQPLTVDLTTDVCIIGAGIAGLATAFFVLRETNSSVLLVERDRAGRGATGYNGGQLTTYFERPLYDLVEEYGFDRAMAAQRDIDSAWGLLDIMITESGATLTIDRFFGHMGMFTLDHLQVHLRSSELKRRAGLALPTFFVAEEAPFLNEIPVEYADLYRVVPLAQIRELLGTGDDRYCAALSDWKGCANGALLIEQVLRYLQTAFPERFRYADHTPIDRITLHDEHAVLEAGDRQVRADRVVMCTNGFVDHIIENLAGGEIRADVGHQVAGDVGYMVGFVEAGDHEPNALSYIRNEVVGGDTPYVYMTSRRHEGPDGNSTLVCLGGPENELDDAAVYDPDHALPADVLAEFDTDVRPILWPARPAGRDYEYAWHGLMAYTESRVRLIGCEPKNPVLLYNLGCNGVGFLPSIYGGMRVAQLVRGDQLDPSIFDPQ